MHSTNKCDACEQDFAIEAKDIHMRQVTLLNPRFAKVSYAEEVTCPNLRFGQVSFPDGKTGMLQIRDLEIPPRKTADSQIKDLRAASGDLLFQYLKCPNCDAAFLISVSDKEFRKLLNKLNRKGKSLTAQEYSLMREALNRKYFPIFKELFPKAYKACDAQETPQAE